MRDVDAARGPIPGRSLLVWREWTCETAPSSENISESGSLAATPAAAKGGL